MIVFFGVLDSAHVYGDADDSADHEDLKHKVIQGAIEHGAARFCLLLGLRVVSERGFALLVLIRGNSLILVCFQLLNNSLHAYEQVLS